jgi:hypothetical protein
MSGKIIIQNADGTPYTNTSSTEQFLYAASPVSAVDRTCGCTGLDAYAGTGSMQCNERFLCGTLDTDFEKCMQAIDCKMKTDMKCLMSADNADKVAVFMQQMIPHHINAINMAKILLQLVPAADIGADLEDILYNIINVQGFQVHQFRNYLGEANMLSPLGESAGSCYDMTTHVVTCNVPASGCSSYWYPPGYVSSNSGCCHCQASCVSVSDTCDYYDTPLDCPTPAPAPNDESSSSGALFGKSLLHIATILVLLGSVATR